MDHYPSLPPPPLLFFSLWFIYHLQVEKKIDDHAYFPPLFFRFEWFLSFGCVVCDFDYPRCWRVKRKGTQFSLEEWEKSFLCFFYFAEQKMGKRIMRSVGVTEKNKIGQTATQTNNKQWKKKNAHKKPRIIWPAFHFCSMVRWIHSLSLSLSCSLPKVNLVEEGLPVCLHRYPMDHHQSSTHSFRRRGSE